ncbi:MAG: hypothetical protein JSS74_10495 [Actinobacteria bacterium]|nr:hypothetical protein [Actinomycetota bacterium]
MPSTRETRRQWEVDNLTRAAAQIEALKLAAGCVDCGYREHPAALHFDHRDPNTKTRELGWYEDRSKLFSRTRLDRFLNHVRTYCDIRCANCHAVRTAQERHYTHRRDTPPAPESPRLF